MRDTALAQAGTHDVDRHSIRRFLRQVPFEDPANLIIFPGRGLQVDALPSPINGSQHRLVERAPIPVELESIVPNLHFIQVQGRAVFLLRLAPTRNSHRL